MVGKLNFLLGWLPGGCNVSFREGKITNPQFIFSPVFFPWFTPRHNLKNDGFFWRTQFHWRTAIAWFEVNIVDFSTGVTLDFRPQWDCVSFFLFLLLSFCWCRILCLVFCGFEGDIYKPPIRDLVFGWPGEIESKAKPSPYVISALFPNVKSLWENTMKHCQYPEDHPRYRK